jgi:hypothetical protein
MVKNSFFAGMAAMAMATSLHAEVEMAASLDVLLDVPKCWELTPDSFEKHFDAIRPELFRWITSDRTRVKLSRALYSNAKIELTAFGGVVPVEEAVVDFSGGRLNMVTLSIFNRGDAGEIGEADFKSRHIAAGKAVGAKLNAKPTARTANRQQGLVTEGYSWSSPSGVAMLEMNEGALSGSAREFLRLRIARPDAEGALAASMKNGGGAAAARLSDLPGNVARDDKGNVFIRNLPMVDQGNKGYCLPASTQRIFEYYGIGADMHQIAQVADSDPGKGTSALSMAKELDRIDFRFKTRLVVMAMMSERELVEVEVKKGEYLVGKPVDERKFMKGIHDFIDDGIPLLWSLELGRFPEEPDLKPQTSGGHMRIIIGYNESTGRLIFSDSWGAGHEFKTIKASDAYAASMGLFALKPTLR